MAEELSLVAPIAMDGSAVGPAENAYVMTITDVNPKRVQARLTQVQQANVTLDSELELEGPKGGNRLNIAIDSFGPARITFVITDKDATFAPQSVGDQPQLAVVKREGDPDFLFDPQWDPQFGGPGKAVSVLLKASEGQPQAVKYGLGIVIGDERNPNFLSPIFFDPVINNNGGPPPPMDPTD